MSINIEDKLLIVIFDNENNNFDSIVKNSLFTYIFMRIKGKINDESHMLLISILHRNILLDNIKTNSIIHIDIYNSLPKKS